ncbi:MAG: Gfo/Idh/MocA family oxidoreductase [Prolixibacteraceae bacterium]|nr:Gfo/Idh/MocA family oxidoreductase [Prolixibacteraceae bacterium]
MKTINWGIIGVGNVTEMKSGPAFNKVPGSRLVAVMRRDASKAEDYARRHNVPRWYDDADDLLNDKEVDAVYVATPPDKHAEYAIRAMRASKPVYVEKPMAMNHRQCMEMLDVSRDTGMPMFVAYYRRTLPAFVKVKELLEAGEIGKPLTFNIRLYREAAERNMKPREMSWHVNPQIGGGGRFFDLASHQIDYLNFLFGKIADVKGFAANGAALYPAEDTVSGIFNFESGVTGTGSWCFAAHKSCVVDTFEIIGDEGMITLSFFIHGEVVMQNRTGIRKFRFQNPENIQFYLIRQVVEALQNNTPCVSTGETAAQTSAILDEMVKNYYQNQHIGI